MNLQTFTGGFVQTNGYILELEDNECLVIDAPQGITAHLRELGLKPTHLLLTHQHFDHVEEVAALREAGAKVWSYHPYDPEIIMEKRVREMGLPVEIPPYEIDEVLKGTPSLEAAGLTFEIAHVPGHSPDSISFHLVAESFLFAGDALFNGSIGRTDLPGGDHDQLLDSIRKKLYTLPEETAVFPGHGPRTSIASEKAGNPFCPHLG